MTHAIVNEDANARLIRDLKDEVSRLRAMLSGAGVEGASVVSDSHLKELRDKLLESERLMKNMSMSWEEKLRIAHRALEERAAQLKSMGISVQGGGIALDADKSYLINLHPTIDSDELTMYHISKHTRVGCARGQDIQLRGEGILAEHCLLPLEGGEMFIMPLLDAEVLVNGERITHKTKLSHGAVIRLGADKELRVSCPRTGSAAAAAAAASNDEDEDGGLQSNMSWPGSKFHRACEAGDLGQVQLMVSKGMDVNSDDARWKRPPLMLAADRGHKQLCHYLISEGAQPGRPDERGYTPLHAAADSGHKEICMLLVSMGAPADPVAVVGCTPLQRAADMGHVEICHFLLSKGANPNAQDRAKGWTPLLLAALRGKAEVCELLIAHGANPNVRNRYGETPLHMSAEPGHVEVINLLLANGADATAEQAYGRTAFDYASETTSFLLLHSTPERTAKREEACRILFTKMTYQQRSTRSLTDRKTMVIAQATKGPSGGGGGAGGGSGGGGIGGGGGGGGGSNGGGGGSGGGSDGSSRPGAARSRPSSGLPAGAGPASNRAGSVKASGAKPGGAGSPARRAVRTNSNR